MIGLIIYLFISLVLSCYYLQSFSLRLWNETFLCVHI